MDVESYTHYQECMKQPIRPGLVQSVCDGQVHQRQREAVFAAPADRVSGGQ